MDPATIRQQYGVPADEAGDTTSPAQAIFLAGSSTYGQALLDAFNAHFDLPAITVNDSLTAQDQQSLPDTDDEAAFDVQAITSMGRGVRTYYVGGNENGESLGSFLADELSRPDIPFSVISFSEMDAPEAVAAFDIGEDQREGDRQIVKLAARGVSFITASGDWGAPGYGSAPFNPSEASGAFVGGLQDTACNSFTVVMRIPYKFLPKGETGFNIGPWVKLTEAEMKTWQSTGGEGGVQVACPFPESMKSISWCQTGPHTAYAPHTRRSVPLGALLDSVHSACAAQV